MQFCATNGLCIMNTFFQHKRIRKYTWYRDSLGQHSLIDFCIVSADLFSTVSDVRVKRGAELSTDHHLVVCTLKALKPLKKRRLFDHEKLIESNGNHWLTKRYELHLQTTLHRSSKNFRPLLKTLKLFRTALIASATNCYGRKRVGGTKSSEKRTPWWNQEVKEAIRAKKVAYRPGLQISYYLNFVRSTLKHIRRQPQKLNCLRKGSGRNLEKGWTMISKRQTKCSGRPFAVCAEKDLEPFSLLKIQMV